MTRPTPREELYRWHAEAVRLVGLGVRLEVPDEAQPGWYRRRLVRGGPFVAVAITMEQPVDEDGELCGDETLAAWIGGNWRDPHEEWTYCAGQPITEAEFRFMEARARHAAQNVPLSPFAAPRRPVDWLSCKLPEF